MSNVYLSIRAAQNYFLIIQYPILSRGLFIFPHLVSHLLPNDEQTSMKIFFEFMRGRETSCSTNCFWAVETCVEIDLQIIHNGRWWWDPLHFVEHRGGKNTLFVAMALLAYNNNLWIYIVWPVLIRYAPQQYYNTKKITQMKMAIKSRKWKCL